jgi:hypothetical protein
VSKKGETRVLSFLSCSLLSLAPSWQIDETEGGAGEKEENGRRVGGDGERSRSEKRGECRERERGGGGKRR